MVLKGKSDYITNITVDIGMQRKKTADKSPKSAPKGHRTNKCKRIIRQNLTEIHLKMSKNKPDYF